MPETKMALNEETTPTETKVATNVAASAPPAPTGLEFRRYFTDGKRYPFDAVEWERRTAKISNEKGQVIFRQENIEVPKAWSQTATNIVASKYFHGKPDTPERETSVRHLIGRVADTITAWGEKGSYFASAASRDAFHDELTHLLVEQKMAFNSPVWFNVGVQAKPQCSACFINSVQDNMGSIMRSGQDRGHALQVGLGHGHEFFLAARQPRVALRRRHCLRAGQLHEGLLTPLPASSRAAGRRAAPPRWSSSTWTIRTSLNSSTAR